MVAMARKSAPQKIDAIAQGRVWTGKDTLRRAAQRAEHQQLPA